MSYGVWSMVQWHMHFVHSVDCRCLFFLQTFFSLVFLLSIDKTEHAKSNATHTHSLTYITDRSEKHDIIKCMVYTAHYDYDDDDNNSVHWIETRCNVITRRKNTTYKIKLCTQHTHSTHTLSRFRRQNKTKCLVSNTWMRYTRV